VSVCERGGEREETSATLSKDLFMGAPEDVRNV
jgi:hypothetical protein